MACEIFIVIPYNILIHFVSCNNYLPNKLLVSFLCSILEAINGFYMGVRT